MAITAALVTALGGGKIDYVPLTPNSKDFTVELPPGTWLVQVEANSTGTSPYQATVGGVDSPISPKATVLLTRIVSGGTLTGSISINATFTHGIAIRLGD